MMFSAAVSKEVKINVTWDTESCHLIDRWAFYEQMRVSHSAEMAHSCMQAVWPSVRQPIHTIQSGNEAPV